MILNKTIVQSTMFYSFQKEKVWKVKGTLCCLDTEREGLESEGDALLLR